MELTSHFLGKLYSTAENPQRWTPVLDDLRARLGVGSAVVQVLNENSQQLNAVWQARDTRSIANSDLHDRCLNNPANPRLHKRSISSLPRDILAELMLVGSDRRLFGRHPLVLAEIQGRLAQVGLGHAFWLSFPVGETRRFSLIMHRQAGDDRDLTEAEEAVLRELLPHMQQATRLWLSLEKATAHANALESALNRVDLAVVMCDADLTVRWHNATADELIAKARAIRIDGGKLKGNGAANRATLRRLVGDVISRIADSKVGMLDADTYHPIHVRATRSLATPFPLENDQVALFFSEPRRANQLDPADLCTLFGLTPAEARLAVALAGGASLASYSKHRGISVGTARNQLKQVLSKTSTQRQSELVRTLCHSAVSQAR